MLSSQPLSDIPALHHPRWVFITLKIEGDFYDHFHHTLYPFLAESKEKGVIEHYLFTQEVNQVVLLFLKTTPYKNTLFIKPYLEKIYGNGIVTYMDFYLFNFVSPYSPITEELLTTSSYMLTQFIQTAKEEGNEDGLFPHLLAMHLVFTYAMGMRRNEIKEFYNYTFHNSIRFAFDNQQQQSNQLIEELRSNFELQQSDLVAYVDYIYSQLEENELEEHAIWHHTCKKAGEEIEHLYQSKRFKQDTDFQYDKSLASSKALQERWELFEQYLYFIDGQLTNVYNLQYILKESICHRGI